MPEALMETKMTEILLYQGHIFLAIGIFMLLYVVRAVKPLGDFLFSDKVNWVIPLLNVSLSSIGIFALRMTNATEVSTKIVIMLVISAITTYGYELTKPLLRKIWTKLFGDVQPDPPKPPSP